MISPSCLFCNNHVILECPWQSHILPCDGLTEFVFFFYTSFALSLHHPYNHGLEVSGFSLKSK